MLTKRPILSRFALFVFAPLLVIGATVAWSLFNSLPQQRGQLFFTGLQESVSVVRDSFGVPHVTAATDTDAFFSLGYLHAQDRLLQMEMQRRLSQGRLSELLGADALQTDKFMRTLGLSHSAQTSIPHLGNSAIESLKAYADGVNAWLQEDHQLPIEFSILRVKPEPWKIEDSIALVKLLAFNLGANYSDEIEFGLLIRELGYERANELHPSGSKQDQNDNPQVKRQTAISGVQQLVALNNQLEKRFKLGGEGVGSNAWVVSGRHTKSGLPLLANDPHLGTQIPSIWYLAELKGDNLHVTGATLPGLPCVVFGHNAKIAWGGTAMAADVQDLYIERVNPRNPNQYELDGVWVDMSVREEFISVKPQFPASLKEAIPPLKWQVRNTRHGPVISDVVDDLDFSMALSWTALAPDDTSYQSFLEVNYAKNWTEFRAALSGFVAPAINFLYADKDGNIGLLAGGHIPIRGEGDGRIPAPGWNGSHDWQGRVSFDELPRSYNPESGVLINANNQNHRDDYKFLISTNWAPPFRAQRISQVLNQLLSDGHELTVEDFEKLQGDVKNIQSTELLPYLTNLDVHTDKQEMAVSYLKNWDGESHVDSVATSIYLTWLRHFNRALISDDLHGELLTARRSDQLQGFVDDINPAFIRQIAYQEQGKSWCDNRSTPQTEECRALALDALTAALQELTRLAGSNQAKWQWGKIHKTQLPHTVFSETEILESIFNREIASPGDAYTVNVAASYFTKTDGYKQYFGASYRQVIDLSDWNNSRFISNTGQSGNVFSEHYDDLVLPHRDMRFLPMRFGDQIENGKVLNLHPAAAQ